MAAQCSTSSCGTYGISKATAITIISILGFTPILLLLLGPKLVFWAGRTLGFYLRNKTAGRKAQILELVEKDELEWEKNGKGRRDSDEWENVEASGTAGNGDKGEDEWDGIVGFFHPFCNAGGGGERVLWAAIRATQKRWPKAKIVVYTGDHDVDKAAMLARVKNRFNIHLHPPTVTFLYLTTRSWVLASSWPHFTLLGQSIGSLVLAWDAFSLVVPDIFIDTMGYAFSLAFSKLLFPSVPTGAYVHYPTISTDMLSSLSPSSNTTHGVNAGKGRGAAGVGKKIYWHAFAYLYSFVGSSIDIVMTNSSWTLSHIVSLWGPSRRALHKTEAVTVYPPVAVSELSASIDVSPSSEKKREPNILYIAQFRPEKNHSLILRSFALFKRSLSPASLPTKLILIGSVRDDSDSKRVYELRLLANELQIRDSVEFHLDASWPEILEALGKASVGVNGMWNEHFGIGVVEYQAAGLISVVHDSGGPKRDIVVPGTGYLASSEEEFAAGFEKALGLGEGERVGMRVEARRSSGRFTEGVFEEAWVREMENLVGLERRRREESGKGKVE